MINKHSNLTSWLRALLAALAMLCAGVGHAGQDVPTFFDLDKDGDGVISNQEGEYWTALLRVWERVDSNRDGVLDMREWNALDAKALSSRPAP